MTQDGKNWSLYNLHEEETELTDLSKEEPDRFKTLPAKYNAWRQATR